MPSKKPKLTAYLTLSKDMNTRFRSKLRSCSVRTITDPLTEGNLHADTEILAVFVDSTVSAEMIKSMPKLKLIVTLSTGYDHIDLAAANKQGVTVCNVPSYGESTVAEYALGLMLSATRNLFPATKSVKEGKYAHEGFRGTDIEGKTIGIIGTGRIGRHLIQLLSGFGAELIGYDPYPHESLQDVPHFTYVTLPTLLRRSDIISLHAPLTADNRHLINKAAIKKMKPGVTIVNTARGGLISSADLLWGLEQGIVGSAALDVLEEENLMEDPCLLADHNCSPESAKTALMNNLLIDHERTIVTAHNAFNTYEAVCRIVDTSAKNVSQFLNGDPTHVVNS